MTAGPEEIALAVARLKAGGLVAFPTETVYGLGADALDAAAVQRVFDLKGRPAINPLIVHVADEATAKTVAAQWAGAAQALAGAFWPGPLTLVLPKASSIPEIVTAGGSTVGIRCPAHHLTLSLLQAFGRPLVGPSANASGHVSPTTADHVRESFSQDQVLVLDGGPCRGGIESTVLSLVDNPPRVLRPGLIGAGQIAKVLRTDVREYVAENPEAPASPGLLPVHYAPRTRAVLVDAAAVGALLREGTRVAVLARTFPGVAFPHHLIRMPQQAAEYASRLYAAIREADSFGADLIAIERPPLSDPIWQAVADRLRRATA